MCLGGDGCRAILNFIPRPVSAGMLQRAAEVKSILSCYIDVSFFSAQKNCMSPCFTSNLQASFICAGEREKKPSIKTMDVSTSGDIGYCDLYEMIFTKHRYIASPFYWNVNTNKSNLLAWAISPNPTLNAYTAYWIN